MNLYIRNARISDLDTLVAFGQEMALVEDVSLVPETLRAGITAVITDFHQAKGLYLVAQDLSHDHTVLVGQVFVAQSWSDWKNGWIWCPQSLWVPLAHRGQGIAKALMNEIRERAKFQNVRSISGYVANDNTVARNLYEKMGATNTGYLMYDGPDL